MIKALYFDDFVWATCLEKFDKCTKAELLIVPNFFNAHKMQWKQNL